MVETRALWSTAPPEPRSRISNNPTLLFSWWCTCFSLAIILTRLCGRKIRSNVLFREDWIMMLAIVPLFARMACIHVVLIWGTNNIQTEGHVFTAKQLAHHSMGARVVLAARIFYAAFIWVSKWSVSEFLKRITMRTWRRSYEITLRCIRAFLILTFIAVVIATLSECQPFDHYWQVIPDPGPHCRQGFAQLLTMGVCDIITDILIIIFPIPIILTSGASWKRKLQLGALFSLSLIMIAVTAMRMPEVISHRGRQQYRTVWASCEILASTAVSNAVSLGSFLRDKGVKRNKFRASSQMDSVDRASVRRPTQATLHPTNSDEDLFRSLGCRIPDHLQDKHEMKVRPAPPAFPTSATFSFDRPSEGRTHEESSPPRESIESDAMSGKSPLDTSAPESSTATQKSPNENYHFFDMGGLLEDSNNAPFTPPETRPHYRVQANSFGVTSQDFAARVRNLPDLAHVRPLSPFGQLGVIPSPSVSRSSHGSNILPPANIRAIVESHGQDIVTPRATSPRSRRPPQAPIGVLGPMLERRDTAQSLQDVGGLLSPVPSSIFAGPSTPRSPEHFAPVIVQPTSPVLFDVGGLLDHGRRTSSSSSLTPRPPVT